MRVLVTGGAGFIGSHVTEALLAAGHEVRVFDSLVRQVHGGNPPRYLPHGAEFVRADVRDRGALLAALQRIDQVVHLAAEVGVGQSMYQVSRYVDANMTGTATLLDIVANEPHQIQKIVVASSMSIYGEGEYDCAEHRRKAPPLRSSAQLRSRQWDLRCPDCGRALRSVATPESKRLFPASVYAISKMDQELMSLAVGAAYGIDVTAMRFASTYGPRQALANPYTGVAAIFAARLLSGQPVIITEDGEQLRDFVHVKDVARATVAALSCPATDGRSINIGSGRPVSINQVAQCLAKELDRTDLEPEVTGTFRTGDVRHCWADPTLARELLGFEARYQFTDDGVRDLAAWVAEQHIMRPADAMLELAMRGLTW
jgi:dTDP-L-rhamnose 4-epimerase